MATCRVVLPFLRSAKLFQPCRMVSTSKSFQSDGPHYVDPHRGKVVTDATKDEFPESLGHSVGKQRWEEVALLHGDDDPYKIRPLQVNYEKNSFNDPQIVYVNGGLEQRDLGCVCDERNHAVMWMRLNLNEKMRCRCGHWFKLEATPTPDWEKYVTG